MENLAVSRKTKFAFEDLHFKRSAHFHVNNGRYYSQSGT